MKISSVIFLAVCLVVIVSVLCILFVPSAQDFMANNTMWNGIEEFTKESDARALTETASVPEKPENTAMIVIPYQPYGEDELTKIRQYLSDGGTVLLFDDYGYGNSILEYLGLGVRFSGSTLLDPLFCYKNPKLPKIIDFTSEVKDSGVKSIVMNHATALANTGGWDIIAWSSPTSFLDSNENGKWEENEPKGPLPVASRFNVNRGTLILVTDPSIIISSMVGRDDNYAFIKYLTTYHGEQKQLYVDESHLTQATLDISKTMLYDVRQMIASPWLLLIVIAVVFIFVSRYIIGIGETHA